MCIRDSLRPGGLGPRDDGHPQFMQRQRYAMQRAPEDEADRRTVPQPLSLIHICHRLGLPVRGQSTKNNARTRKGRKKTVANKKKATK